MRTARLLCDVADLVVRLQAEIREMKARRVDEQPSLWARQNWQAAMLRVTTAARDVVKAPERMLDKVPPADEQQARPNRHRQEEEEAERDRQARAAAFVARDLKRYGYFWPGTIGAEQENDDRRGRRAAVRTRLEEQLVGAGACGCRPPRPGPRTRRCTPCSCPPSSTARWQLVSCNHGS